MADHEAIDRISANFAQACQHGDHPRIDEFLSEYSGGSEETLLLRLIDLELKYAQVAPAEANADSYVSRFPQHAEPIQAWFRSYSGVGSGEHNGSTVGIDEVVGGASQTDTFSFQRLGRYELRRIVGRGAFGEVWQAYDPQLRREVALKTPRDDVRTSSDVRRQFVSEGRKAARLQHPGIVRVYDAGEDQGRCYIVSELIHGGTLRQKVKDKSLTVERAIETVGRVAEGLDYAHRQGVVHRDIKPGNILIDADGSPHISDFGLAKVETGELSVVHPGAIVGTPAYMSPEQASGHASEADGRTDIYSLGVVLYELLTHRQPFAGSSSIELLERICQGDYDPMQDAAAEVPDEVERVCRKAMALRPEDRFATSGEFASELRALIQPETQSTVQAGSTRWNRGHWILLSAVSVLGFFATCLMLGSMFATPQEGVRVRIGTDPPGAAVAFIPLDAATGIPQPEDARTTSGNPGRVRVKPGRFLVVATLEDGRFHEVYRTVPAPDVNNSGGPFWHQDWLRDDDGVVSLPKVYLPAASVNEGLIRFAGSPRAGLGASSVNAPAAYWARVPPFLAASCKVDHQMFSERIGLNKLPTRFLSRPEAEREPFERDKAPLSFISWEEAMHCAERAGLRLLDEIEFEFAAREALKNSSHAGSPSDWLLPPAEWTVSCANSLPLGPDRRIRPGDPGDRVVRGFHQSPDSVVESEDLVSIVNSRFIVDQRFSMAHIGFRLARSTKPRRHIEDFPLLLIDTK